MHLDTLRPLLRYSLAFFWLVSAITGAYGLRAWAVLLTMQMRIDMAVALTLFSLACLLSLVLAILVVRRWRPRRVAQLQAAALIVLTAIATLLFPSLWTEPLGPLAKNLPIIAAALAWGEIEEAR